MNRFAKNRPAPEQPSLMRAERDDALATVRALNSKVAELESEVTGLLAERVFLKSAEKERNRLREYTVELQDEYADERAQRIKNHDEIFDALQAAEAQVLRFTQGTESREKRIEVLRAKLRATQAEYQGEHATSERLKAEVEYWKEEFLVLESNPTL